MISGTEDIEFSERYDNEDDIYYVTARTGEPSIAIEQDDILLVEMGIFTRAPTGFRIFDYSQHKDKAAEFLKYFKELCIQLGLRKLEASDSLKRDLEKAVEKLVAA